MTEKCYFTSDALQWTTRIVHTVHVDGGVDVITAQTVFHPRGGGQPADSGTLNGLPVRDVFEADDGIHHRLDAPVEGDTALLHVDAAQRLLHARLHSAGHLLAYAGATFGLLPRKAQHGPGDSKVVFDGAIDTLDPDALAACCQRLIAQQLPRRMRLHNDGRREIAFGEEAFFPCGGTHVDNTRQVGRMLIQAISRKKQALSVHYALA